MRRRVVLEGGTIDVNGCGALLTTEECLLSPVQARNPGLSRPDLERILGDHLGVRKVLWLGEGSRATTPTATSTTWPASSTRAPWRSRWRGTHR